MKQIERKTEELILLLLKKNKNYRITKNMKNLLILILIFGLNLSLFSQDDKHSYYEFSKKTSIFIEADKTSEGKQILRVKVEADAQENDSKTQENTFNLEKVYDKDDYIFSENYKSENLNFIIIKSNFAFYLYDLNQHKLSSLQKPVFFGFKETDDDEIIDFLKIANDKKRIYGKCKTGGVFLFDICNPVQPKEIFSLNPPFFGTDRFFEVAECGKNTYKGILISYTEDDGITTDELFSNKKLILHTDNKIANLTEEEIEDRIMNFSVYDSKFAITQEIKNDNSKEFIVIDIYNKKIINIPSENSENSDKIKKFLLEKYKIDIE